MWELFSQSGQQTLFLMAARVAKDKLSSINKRCYKTTTNVGFAVTKYDKAISGRYSTELQKIDNENYVVGHLNLDTGAKPNVTSTQFQAHCRMAVYGSSVTTREPTAKEVKDNISAFSQYDGANITVMKLPKDSKGSVQVGTSWLYHLEQKGDTWYYCIVS